MKLHLVGSHKSKGKPVITIAFAEVEGNFGTTLYIRIFWGDGGNKRQLSRWKITWGAQ